MITSVVTVIALGVIAVIGLALYLLPVLVGWARHAPDLAALAVINILLGWTLVGWVVALAMALRTVSPSATVQVIQNLPPGIPPSAQPGQAGMPRPGRWNVPPATRHRSPCRPIRPTTLTDRSSAPVALDPSQGETAGGWVGPLTAGEVGTRVDLHGQDWAGLPAW